MFSLCDTNRDYQIDYSEARISIVHKNDSNYISLPSINYTCRISQINFKKYDANSDNLISFNEFIHPPKKKKILQSDTNRGGQFKYKDIKLIYKAKLFHEIDEDGNGKLDFDEWIAVY